MRNLTLWMCFAAVAARADQAALDRIRGDHGLSLAISGMLIVFIGLTAIALFIGWLPKVLSFLENRGWTPASHGHAHGHTAIPVKTSATMAAVTPGDVLDAATLAAITLVLHAEAERAAGQQLKVTIGLNPSPWALSSQMRIIPGRIK